MKVVVILKQIKNESWEHVSLCESDKYVLAEAIQFAHESSGSVTVIGYGGSRFEQPLKECLTLGINQAIHFDTQDLIPSYSAGIANELKHLDFDLILCGAQTGDKGSYLTSVIAKKLNIPHITHTTSLAVADQGSLLITRQVQNKIQKLKCRTPLLCISVNKSYPPIHPKIADIMKVYSGENKVCRYPAAEILVSDELHRQNNLSVSTQIHIEETKSALIWISGSDEKEKADKLYQLLQEKIMIPDLPKINPAIIYLEESYLQESKLAETKLIVGGGRGLKKDGFKLLEKLASLLGGSIGCTRPCVDAGWIGDGHLIGQFGANVHPKVYLAFGISGAVQHVSGMKDSDCIIGINTNPNADIFRYCDYGIEGDAVKILNHLLGK